MKHRIFRALAIVLLLTALGCAQDVASFEKRITVKTSPKPGLTLLLRAAGSAGVLILHSVDAGSTQRSMRQHRLAHMFEHSGFPRAGKIGTTDYAAEKPRSKKWRPASCRLHPGT